MAANILFTLVDQYGNSLKDFRFDGRFTFIYIYSDNRKPNIALEGQLTGGIAYGDLPKLEKGLESTRLIIEFNSEFYNAPGALLYKGQYPAAQNISVSKKTLDPKQRAVIIEKSIDELKQVASKRVGGVIDFPKELA